jgi:hypothetical protein
MPDSSTKPNRYEDLSPMAQELVRKKSLGSIFFASLIMAMMGASCVIEGFYILTRDDAFLIEQFPNLDADKAKISSLMLAAIGLLEAVCAVGTIRLSVAPYKIGFYMTILVAGNRVIDGMIFHGTFFTFGSILNLILALFALLFLFAGRYAVLNSSNFNAKQS